MKLSLDRIFWNILQHNLFKSVPKHDTCFSKNSKKFISFYKLEQKYLKKKQKEPVNLFVTFD